MSREFLLRSLSAVAISAASAPAALATTSPAIINGGGATAAQGNYAGPNSSTNAPLSELSTFNASETSVQFGTYWGSGSGAGQTAFLNNDLTCDINKVTGANGGACSNTPGGADTVHYAVSEGTLNTTQTGQWSTSTWGQSAAGNLIQLPSLGSGLAIPVLDSNITKNGQLELTDSDLCEIFSGGYTNFSQITDSGTFKPAAGTINVVYRSDSAGTTSILTQHLSKVCTPGTNSNITFTATATFATLFPSSTPPTNFTGEKGNAGVTDYLSGLSGTPPAQAIGYVSPDWTSIASAPDNQLSNGSRPDLLVAAIFYGTKAYTPTIANLKKAFTHIAKTANGISNPPSTAATGANPLNWVPVIQTVSAGYPIVGYGTFDVAQCYANPTIEAGVIAYLTDHYKSATYLKIQNNNGFVAVSNTSAAKFLTTIYTHILENTGTKKNPAWNINIGNTTACAGLAGR
jgi:ABC-type phosphate transport system substrate-binding protein